jgi:hypothetical protein
MQDWINQYFPVIFPFYFVALWILVTYWIALSSGWRLLAKRFRFQGVFEGRKRHMQSARMRAMARYNNVLTIGADNTGLFIVPMFLFRAWHPPLFIPWVEITAVRKTSFSFLNLLNCVLGVQRKYPSGYGQGWPPKLKLLPGRLGLWDMSKHHSCRLRRLGDTWG